MADPGATWSWLVDQGPTVAVLGLSVWALATGRVRPGADYDRAMSLAEAGDTVTVSVYHETGSSRNVTSASLSVWRIAW